jgi:hypothetical protein
MAAELPPPPPPPPTALLRQNHTEIDENDEKTTEMRSKSGKKMILTEKPGEPFKYAYESGEIVPVEDLSLTPEEAQKTSEASHSASEGGKRRRKSKRNRKKNRSKQRKSKKNKRSRTRKNKGRHLKRQ